MPVGLKLIELGEDSAWRGGSRYGAGCSGSNVRTLRLHDLINCLLLRGNLGIGQLRALEHVRQRRNDPDQRRQADSAPPKRLQRRAARDLGTRRLTHLRLGREQGEYHCPEREGDEELGQDFAGVAAVPGGDAQIGDRQDHEQCHRQQPRRDNQTGHQPSPE